MHKNKEKKNYKFYGKEEAKLQFVSFELLGQCISLLWKLILGERAVLEARQVFLRSPVSVNRCIGK
jgi:hypothetical protein